MTGPRPAGDPWTADDDRTLMAMIAAKTPVAVIARKLNRTIGAVQSRRNKLRRLAHHQRSAMVEATNPTSGGFTRHALPERNHGRGGGAAGAD
jgi:hypothetical protein